MSTPGVVWWLAGTLPPLGAAWALWRWVLRPEACFGYNRALLLLAPALAAAWPLLPHPALLGLDQFRPPTAGTVGAVAVPLGRLPMLYASATEHALGWPGWQWLAAVYATGVAVGLGWLAWRYGQLYRATRRLPRLARPGYQLAHTGGQLPTSSWGRLVLWDETIPLTSAEAQAVLAHELAHVRQGHTRDVLWGQLWRIVLWPNPFAHLLLPALRLTHELLADRAALAATPPGTAPMAYPALLARLATQPLLAGAGRAALLQAFHFSFTLTRLAMLQRPHPVRRWKQWLVLPMLGGLFVVACQTSPALAQAVPSSLTNPATPPPPPPPPPILTDLPELPSGGGQQALLWAISKGLTYPNVLAGQQRQGQVAVEFKVGTDGRVRDARIVHGLAPAYDAAVLAAVQQLPVLKPAQRNGQPIEQTLTVPLDFGTQPARWRPAGASNPTP